MTNEDASMASTFQGMTPSEWRGWRDQITPLDGRMFTDSGYPVSVGDYYARALNALSPFAEAKVVERTPVITLSSAFPLSVIRDQTDGTVTSTQDEFKVGPESMLQSAEIGRYVAGYPAEVGIGLRLNNAQAARWGYFSPLNGVFWQYDAAGFSVGIRKDSVDLIIPRYEWNLDRLDGEGPSQIDISGNQSGLIWQIMFTWYGYGSVCWYILDNRTGVMPTLWPVHVEGSPVGGTSTNVPNLPIRVENNGTSGDVYVGGRQFSIVGKYVPNERDTTAFRDAVNVTTAWTPIISARRKGGETCNPYSFIMRSVESIWGGEGRCLVATVIGGTVTGGEYDGAILRSPGETGVEFNVTATSFNAEGAEIITPLDLIAGVPSGGTPQNRVSQTSGLASAIRIPCGVVVSLIARTTSGSGPLSAAMTITEEW